MLEPGKLARILTTHIVGVITKVIPAEIMPNPADGNGYEIQMFSGNTYIKSAYELEEID